MAEEIRIGIRQKLRGDFISGEPNALMDEALLELLLSYALNRGNPEPLARKLILEFGGLDGVLSSEMARREYVDTRDWREYNESLVRRNKLYFSFEFLDRWKNDLTQMDEGKVGRRYLFPDPFIQHLMMLHIILFEYPAACCGVRRSHLISAN